MAITTSLEHKCLPGLTLCLGSNQNYGSIILHKLNRHPTHGLNHHIITSIHNNTLGYHELSQIHDNPHHLYMHISILTLATWSQINDNTINQIMTCTYQHKHISQSHTIPYSISLTHFNSKLLTHNTWFS